MKVIEIFENKKDFMELLLIGDEEEAMVLKYLEAGNLYALYDSEILKSVCVTLPINKDTVEIKNLATYPKFQKQGCASFLLNFIFNLQNIQIQNFYTYFLSSFPPEACLIPAPACCPQKCRNN